MVKKYNFSVPIASYQGVFFRDNYFLSTFFRVEVFCEGHKKLFSKVKTKREINSNFVAFLKRTHILSQHVVELGYFYQNSYYCPDDWPKEGKSIYFSVHTYSLWDIYLWNRHIPIWIVSENCDHRESTTSMMTTATTTTTTCPRRSNTFLGKPKSVYISSAVSFLWTAEFDSWTDFGWAGKFTLIPYTFF